MTYCFFFNDTATTEIYTLSLHDALPISTEVVVYNNPYRSPADYVFLPALFAIVWAAGFAMRRRMARTDEAEQHAAQLEDRKSTRLNSSHLVISYAVFCLKKKTPSEMSTASSSRTSPSPSSNPRTPSRCSKSFSPQSRHTHTASSSISFSQRCRSTPPALR